MEKNAVGKRLKRGRIPLQAGAEYAILQPEGRGKTMVSRKKKQKKVPVWPVLAVVAVLLAAAVILEVRPSTERADLNQYLPPDPALSP